MCCLVLNLSFKLIFRGKAQKHREGSTEQIPHLPAVKMQFCWCVCEKEGRFLNSSCFSKAIGSLGSIIPAKPCRFFCLQCGLSSPFLSCFLVCDIFLVLWKSNQKELNKWLDFVCHQENDYSVLFKGFFWPFLEIFFCRNRGIKVAWECCTRNFLVPLFSVEQSKMRIWFYS